MALNRTVPEYPLDTDAGSISVSESLWPYLSNLLRNLIETKVPYIVEGEILPKHIDALRKIENRLIPACLVGYSEIDVETKLREVSDHQGHPNDWTAELSDEKLGDLLIEGINYSRYLQQECQLLGIHYVDFSSGFAHGVKNVMRYFMSTQSTG
jgi:hypothetical protein